jgi:hypothetical protein
MVGDEIVQIDADQGGGEEVDDAAFFIWNGESTDKKLTIASADGKTILACSKPISKKGEGSNKFAENLFQKFDEGQVCLVCSTYLSQSSKWAARSHLLHVHQMYCDYEELCQHNKKWIDQQKENWKAALIKSQSSAPSKILGKRGIEQFCTVKSTQSATAAGDLRRAYAIAVCRGMLPYSFVNSPGKVIYNSINSITC